MYDSETSPCTDPVTNVADPHTPYVEQALVSADEFGVLPLITTVASHDNPSPPQAGTVPSALAAAGVPPIPSDKAAAKNLTSKAPVTNPKNGTTVSVSVAGISGKICLFQNPLFFSDSSILPIDHGKRMIKVVGQKLRD